MAKPKIKEKRKQVIRKTNQLPFTKKNYQFFGLGLLVIIIGYIFLSIGPADSTFSLTIAPIFLVSAYCIIIPISILYREKRKEKSPPKVKEPEIFVK